MLLIQRVRGHSLDDSIFSRPVDHPTTGSSIRWAPDHSDDPDDRASISRNEDGGPVNERGRMVPLGPAWVRPYAAPLAQPRVTPHLRGHLPSNGSQVRGAALLRKRKASFARPRVLSGVPFDSPTDGIMGGLLSFLGIVEGCPGMSSHWESGQVAGEARGSTMGGPASPA